MLENEIFPIRNKPDENSNHKKIFFLITIHIVEFTEDTSDKKLLGGTFLPLP